MEVTENKKTGFEESEFGWIPKDWKILNLGENASLKARIGWQGLTTAEYLNTGEFILVTGTDFKNGLIDWDNCSFVEKKRYDQDKNIQLRKNDILITKDGTIGKVAFIKKLVKPTTLNSGVFVIRPFDSGIYSLFLYYIFRSFVFDDFLNKLTAGSTIAHLYQKDFVTFNFPLPSSFSEQKAIAKALSDVDDLIEKLDALITKKQAIKEGAMQRLLTPPHKGGQRLPGFDGEWEEKKLGEITDLITKGTTPTSLGKDFTSEGINFIKAESIHKSGKLLFDKLGFIDSETHDLLSRSKIKQDDLLFTIAGVLGRIGMVKKENLPANTNQAVAIIRLKKALNLNIHFFFHLLRTKFIMKHIESISVQGAQANFSLTDVRNISLFFPAEEKEQKAIAKILSDMDIEIDKLQAKKSKYQQIKEGMMQELLTGKTRMV